MNTKTATVAIIAATALTLGGCGMDMLQSDRATEILQLEGYTNIEITGYNPVVCSDDDLYKTTFTATNAAGNAINGVVCMGVMKGATVRILN
jgi:hypothetical protein